MSVELEIPKKKIVLQEEPFIVCVLCKSKIRIHQTSNYNEHICSERSNKDVVIRFVQ